MMDGLLAHLRSLKLHLIDFSIATLPAGGGSNPAKSVMRIYLKDEEKTFQVGEEGNDEEGAYVASVRETLAQFLAIPANFPPGFDRRLAGRDGGGDGEENEAGNWGERREGKG